jgi:hypothetical protein
MKVIGVNIVKMNFKYITMDKKEIIIKTVSYLYQNNMLKNIYTGSWSELHNNILQSLEQPEEKQVKAKKCEYSDETDYCTITVCPYIDRHDIFCNEI